MRHLNWLKLGMSSVIAVLSMGNQQCDSSGSVKPQSRRLKRTIDIQSLDVRNVQVAEGQSFDFQSILPWQTQEALHKTQLYLVPPAPSSESDSATFAAPNTLEPSAAATTATAAKRVTTALPRIADVDGAVVQSGSFASDELTQTAHDVEINSELGGFDFLQKSNASNVGALAEIPTVPLDDPSWPECLRNKAQLGLRGKVMSFVITSNMGIELGYTPIGGIVVAPGLNLSFKVRKARMDLGLQAVDASSGWLRGSGKAAGQETQVSLNATINLGLLIINPSYYYQTPLVQVTEGALKLALDRMTQDLDKNSSQLRIPAWEARVLPGRFPETHVLVNAGRLQGIQPGDRFAVYNATTVWDGPICASNFLRRELSFRPSAIVEIGPDFGELGDSFAYARIVQSYEAVRPGATVHIEALYRPPTK